MRRRLAAAMALDHRQESGFEIAGEAGRVEQRKGQAVSSEPRFQFGQRRGIARELPYQIHDLLEEFRDGEFEVKLKNPGSPSKDVQRAQSFRDEHAAIAIP